MNRTVLLLSVFLVALCLAIYWQTFGFEFVNLDDDRYVLRNPHVTNGLTWQGVKWAFTTVYAANWHPFTWISHMVDCSLFGLHAGRHHITNVLFHVANALLLFWLLVAATKLPWRSMLIAGLFALHPLHVESVAWIAERKDVLSTFFWFLTTLAYYWYIRKGGGKGAYIAVVFCYMLGLLSKPMLVSLPLILLLLDYWPFARISVREGSGLSKKVAFRGGNKLGGGGVSFASIILEKIPLFALALASCVVTLLAQHSGGAVMSTDVYPLGVRLANASVAYVAYLYKMLYPFKMACFYPHPGTTLPVWQVCGSGFLLALITASAVILAKRCPYATVGWFWYVVTLLPVIGLVQVGRQAMADRYTYVPLVGIFVALVWGIAEITYRSRRGAIISVAIAGLILAILATLSFRQIRCWRDSVSLFQHAVFVTRDNGLAYYNLGCALNEAGDPELSRKYIRRALDLLPGGARHYNSYGCDLLEQGMVDMAILSFERAVRADPRFALTYFNLSVAYEHAGERARAIRSLEKAVELDPTDRDARAYLERLKSKMGTR
ncbi:MAG: tetratricopeptide repeat protein [Armatimonadota bacterium]